MLPEQLVSWPYYLEESFEAYLNSTITWNLTALRNSISIYSCLYLSLRSTKPANAQGRDRATIAKIVAAGVAVKKSTVFGVCSPLCKLAMGCLYHVLRACNLHISSVRPLTKNSYCHPTSSLMTASELLGPWSSSLGIFTYVVYYCFTVSYFRVLIRALRSLQPPHPKPSQ